ncbi:hypothetical protein DPMN_076062 [Dreissena polymorpha]|uniref:Uncharacterized protein n=1 Tax=Dreissena polymorpha TaxID=45954 RepID=A0A9D3YLM4_DREPO|nr:hypothetical protein DPMN_076062 [Dreissena polymorpha]
MFGRTPKQPIDSLFEAVDIDRKTNQASKEYLDQLRNRLKHSHEVAKQYADTARDKQKSEYDKKAKAA